MNKKTPVPTLLVILDGFGYSPEKKGNALEFAQMPYLKKVWQQYPNTLLSSAGEHVGLPWGVPGNSEAGHLNTGAGRLVYQSFPTIQRAIADNSFFENKILKDALGAVRKTDRVVHLVGLLSRGGVHSHLDHIEALLRLIRHEKVRTAYLHLFTDGRDADPHSALGFLEDIEHIIKKHKVGRVATLIGRGYAMDRNHHWEECTKPSYEALVLGTGERALHPKDVVATAYTRGITDEFIPPTVLLDPETGQPLPRIKSNDLVIFFNFREDRIRQTLSALTDTYFPHFTRRAAPTNLTALSFAPLRIKTTAQIIFPQTPLKNTISEVIATGGFSQFHIGESEKYAHVTYFFSGRHEEPFPLEKRFLVHSNSPKTFIANPQMGAEEITKKAIQLLKTHTYSFGVINYANPDMVGHTGNFDATVRGLEFLDKQITLLITEAHANGWTVIITADHGNAEQMINLETDEIDTEHSINPVPLIIVDPAHKDLARPFNPQVTGVLADVSPTILDLMGITIPAQMTGYSLTTTLGIKSAGSEPVSD